jgi:SAM-dependent methyltransferase
MTHDPAAVGAYYDWKRPAYEGKYNVGYYTHVHTGLYPPEDYPALHRLEPDEMSRFGIERLRYLMCVGQESTTRLACKSFAGRPFQRILDCGFGHGGSSIYLAENYQLPVTGISLSEQQLQLARDFVQRAGVQDLVDLKIANILELDPAEGRFDGFLAVESLCHIAPLDRLFGRLAKLLEGGSLLTIIDYYIASHAGTSAGASAFKERFDAYWHTDINSLDSLLSAAQRHGFSISEVRDLTDVQLPFWGLSQSHSTLALSGAVGEIDETEKKRLEASRAFHHQMRQAFLKRNLSYYKLRLVR